MNARDFSSHFFKLFPIIFENEQNTNKPSLPQAPHSPESNRYKAPSINPSPDKNNTSIENANINFNEKIIADEDDHFEYTDLLRDEVNQTEKLLGKYSHIQSEYNWIKSNAPENIPEFIDYVKKKI